MASLNVEDASHAASSSSGLASGANPCPRDRWCVNLGDGIDGEQAAGDTRASNGFALRPTARPMKAGIAQMISQAWSRHCRDREAVSKNRFEVLAVLMEQWNGEVRNSMNGDPTCSSLRSIRTQSRLQRRLFAVDLEPAAV